MTGRAGTIAISLFLIGIVPGYLCQWRLNDTAECKQIQLVDRASWKGRPPVRRQFLSLPVSHVIILETRTDFCETYYQCVREIEFLQDFYLNYRGWWDIAYNFMIGGDGRVYAGRGWDVIGAHSRNYNSISIGIGFIGNFQEMVPPKVMLDAALGLIECGVNLGILTPSREIHGHRDVSCTNYIGEKLYRIIRNWPNYKGGHMDEYVCQIQTD